MQTNIEFMKGVKSLQDIDIANKRVLIRVDFNVPLDDHHNIVDDTRIKESLHTINYCRDHNAKYIVLVSHLGRPKVSSKITLLTNILPKVKRILIGGAMSNTFLSAMGIDMKASLIDKDSLTEAMKILQEAKRLKVNIYLPCDVVATKNTKTPEQVKISPAHDMEDGMKAVDIGPATCQLFKEVVSLSHTIIWNGPMGIFEIARFSKGTITLAHTIGDSYAYTIVGGGDTVNALNEAGEREHISFVSTGGGASLELLEGKILPAFEHLDRR